MRTELCELVDTNGKGCELPVLACLKQSAAGASECLRNAILRSHVLFCSYEEPFAFTLICKNCLGSSVSAANHTSTLDQITFAVPAVSPLALAQAISECLADGIGVKQRDLLSVEIYKRPPLAHRCTLLGF